MSDALHRPRRRGHEDRVRHPERRQLSESTLVATSLEDRDKLIEQLVERSSLRDDEVRAVGVGVPVGGRLRDGADRSSVNIPLEASASRAADRARRAAVFVDNDSCAPRLRRRSRTVSWTCPHLVMFTIAPGRRRHGARRDRLPRGPGGAESGTKSSGSISPTATSPPTRTSRNTRLLWRPGAGRALDRPPWTPLGGTRRPSGGSGCGGRRGHGLTPSPARGGRRGSRACLRVLASGWGSASPTRSTFTTRWSRDRRRGLHRGRPAVKPAERVGIPARPAAWAPRRRSGWPGTARAPACSARR